jgi:MoaA/NifB/PqqE/SkfB family radical SAM enzyme
MVIDSTGIVVPCCYWGAYGNNNHPCGNLNKTPLLEIWNGDVYQDLRHNMAKGNLAEAGCVNCLALKQGNEMGLRYNSAAEREVPPVSDYAKHMKLLKQEISVGAAVLRSKPTVISFTPSHACNFRCIHCYQNSTRDCEIFRKEAVPEVLSLTPFLVRVVAGGGEPFILPIWREFIQNADISINPYLEFATSTNASVVTDEILAGLRRFNSIVINVSFDGATKEVYETIRKSGEFEKVVDNIDKFTALTKEKGLPSFTSVTMAVMKANITNIPCLIEFAAQKEIDFGLSPVVSMPVDQTLSCFNNPLLETRGWKEAISSGRLIFEELFAKRLERLNEASKEMYRNHFKIIESSIPWHILQEQHYPVKRHVPARLLQSYVKQYGKDIVICFFPWNDGQPQECRYYAFLTDNYYEVHLPEGKYLVGLYPRYTGPGYFRDWIISVKSNQNGTIEVLEKLPPLYKIVKQNILRQVYLQIKNTLRKWEWR